MKRVKRHADIATIYPWVLIMGGVAGLVSATMQAAERVQMLKHPELTPSCTLNPVIDCGAVLNNHWSSLFGFPNAFIGMVVFAMLLFAGFLLTTGTKLNRKGAKAVWVLSIILIFFAVWFFGMSLYVIGKICVYCIAIWAVSVPIFWYGLLWMVRHDYLRMKWSQRFLSYGQRHHVDTVIGVYLVLLALYILRFRAYYFG